jgi:hypothetical protein
MEIKDVVGKYKTWKDIDITSTLALHDDASEELVASIKDFENTWFNQPKSKAPGHDRAIKACEASMDRLFGGCV